MKSATLYNRAVKKIQLKKGCELTDSEKKFIVSCYEKIPPFPGKVLRTSDNAFHGWERVFKEGFDWAISENGYACAFEGYLCEFYGDAELCAAFEKGFLFEKYPQIGELLDNGWQIVSVNHTPECWHGENVMLRNLKNSISQNLFFPLADKF